MSVCLCSLVCRCDVNIGTPCQSLGGGGWIGWCPEVPSNLNNSVIHIYKTKTAYKKAKVVLMVFCLFCFGGYFFVLFCLWFVWLLF